LALCAGAPSVLIAQTNSPRPNIIFIVADDLGSKDVGFHGSDIKTFNIDKLAQQGARLEQFYVQPMCTPTRAALMTGRYPFRYGLQTLVVPGDVNGLIHVVDSRRGPAEGRRAAKAH
jgi:arylsulfatase A-like enzyme